MITIADPGTPRLRGVSHALGFFAAVPVGLVLAFSTHTPVGAEAAIVFAASVALMFGVSGSFHCIRWGPVAKNRIAIVDHAAIYALIAGTYTPVALLVLRPGWRIPILALVWSGALVATVGKLFFRNAPAWVAAATCVTLGWIAILILPQIVDRVGIGATALLFGGGLAYTAGAFIYARRRPDPFPATFGYHEIFHAFVVVGVACQYAVIAFFVLPLARM